MSLSAVLFLVIIPYLVSSVSGSKCTALCFLDKQQHLACALKSKLPNPEDFSQPVRCVKKEYGTSTEIVIGSSEVVDGLVPGGFDVFITSEQTSRSQVVPIQLTLNVNIKMVGPNIFNKVTNLQRLQVHPYDMHPCAFYALPSSVREVLLQCVGPNMKMLAPMRWPAGSPVEFKLNMCMQETRCHICPGTRSVELKSVMKGPLALKVVSLTECIEGSSCATSKEACDPVTTTTAKPKLTTKAPTTKPTEANPGKTEDRNAQPQSGATANRRASTEERDLRKLESRVILGEKKENFLLLAVAGATVLNSLLLLVILVVLFYAASCCCCCRKRTRGVFFVSKENYPPEYSTLRPV